MAFSGTPSPTVLAYLAGIIDGEGCIQVGAKRSQGNYYSRVSVGMVQDTVVNMLRDAFGGNVRIECYDGNRPIYRWTLCSQKDILRCLTLLEPYLVIKAEQAEVVKAFITEKTVIKNMTTVELERRHDLYLQSRKLNAVGQQAMNSGE